MQLRKQMRRMSRVMTPKHQKKRQKQYNMEIRQIEEAFKASCPQILSSAFWGSTK